MSSITCASENERVHAITQRAGKHDRDIMGGAEYLIYDFRAFKCLTRGNGTWNSRGELNPVCLTGTGLALSLFIGLWKIKSPLHHRPSDGRLRKGESVVTVFVN
ncbi:hypothetical protein TNIN_471171 [Trichonephila inaurata madagascariensis]|uniref:Uncharacterized protein n=1 Tax=Trichonephila inaurata madagascariensis TaxID=2747483 RepID=A0A8X6Y9A4_9ARAC|nr:hypothetical protein TNIN_471171 [Trichonephila inaurata madagascariensis]